MEHIIDELQALIRLNKIRFSEFSELEISHRASPEKWSRKEVIGHLIDSAHNNLRRFISAQYEPTPPQIWYDQDYWVKQNQYQDMNTNDLIQLWVLLNERICVVLRSMEPRHYDKLSNSGRAEPNLLTLKYIAEDYIVHMRHHLEQIYTDHVS